MVWHRGGVAWAVQEACPHAAISLHDADIEDFSLEFPMTAGPCVACPAHMYVFDVGSGHCLTNGLTPAARTYPVHTSRAGGDGQGALHVWLGRTPRPPPSTSVKASRAVGNEIQLRLVDMGLKRRFGDGP